MILSPFPIPPPPHRLPVFPTLPVFKMEDREEIRGREKLLPKWYFLDFILVSSETTSITWSLSLETSTLLLWLDACSFLEHSTSQGGSRDTREFLRLSGRLQGQNHFHHDIKMCCTLFTFFLPRVYSMF